MDCRGCSSVFARTCMPIVSTIVCIARLLTTTSCGWARSLALRRLAGPTPEWAGSALVRSLAATGDASVKCPYCRYPDSRVVDSREADDGKMIRRRRACQECGRRFTTVEEAILAVVKRSGASEPFSRSKVIAGVRKACQGRPVDDDALAVLAQRVEESIRATGSAEVPSHQVGLAILEPLRELDEVAYLRFASVYHAFASLSDFEDEIASLRASQERPESTLSASEPAT